jgi:hypothetical protein
MIRDIQHKKRYLNFRMQLSMKARSACIRSESCQDHKREQDVAKSSQCREQMEQTREVSTIILFALLLGLFMMLTE